MYVIDVVKRFLEADKVDLILRHQGIIINRNVLNIIFRKTMNFGTTASSLRRNLFGFFLTYSLFPLHDTSFLKMSENRGHRG